MYMVFNSMKEKFFPYKLELKKLRNEGYTFEGLAIWLAEEKNIEASPTGIRNFLKKCEIKERLKKS